MHILCLSQGWPDATREVLVGQYWPYVASKVLIGQDWPDAKWVKPW